jgi:hypothetical protein
MSQYSKLIGALVGNLVAILLAYIATKWTGVAECTIVDQVQTCTAFGFSQAQITGALMMGINSFFVWWFPPNKPA